MTPEEIKRRAEDPKVKYLKANICDHNGGKSYVFISYKSDDWETVLTDVVYRLVKDYGLNVYFDGSFDSHNSLWVNQFPENMDDYRCKGVIAFFDDKYATSYATLMELMHSQTYSANVNNVNEESDLPIVPVNLGKLTKISGEEGQRDTGLGKKCYEDGSKNDNYEKELTKFKEDFEELVERSILKKAKYIWKNKDLKASVCSEIVSELKTYKEINDNEYKRGGDLESIVASIKDACGSEVFEQNASHIEEQKKKELVHSTTEGNITEETRTTTTHDNNVERERTEGQDTYVVDENTTLGEFERICENTEICSKIKEYREVRGNGQPVDYLMASLLGGCDEPIKKTEKGKEVVLRPAAKRYCSDAISSDKSNQFTWQSNARKWVKEEERLPAYFGKNGNVASGPLLDYDRIFSKLPKTTTIGEVLEKYRNNEKGFRTRDNEKIIKAWEYIKKINK